MINVKLPRREFLHLAAGAALLPAVSWVASYAQNLQKPYRVGLLSPTAGPSQNDAAFLQGLKELGYVEGQTFILETRYAAGKIELLPSLALELVQAKVDLILAGNYRALLAAKATTSSVPLIMTLGADPVAFGVVDSLVRPGGNVTGLSEAAPHLTPDRLKLLKELIPGLSQVAVLWQPSSLQEVTFRKTVAETEVVGRSLGIDIHVVEVRDAATDLNAAFSAMAAQKAEAVIVLISPMFSGERDRIIAHAASHRLPAIYEWTQFVDAGGLISYGANLADIYRRAAGFADRILKGARPGDLAVEQPTLFDLSVNVKTAATLGLSIPRPLLVRANKVVE
jgi:putative tryptophan/tyrosine transport system substrate-binding protein